MAEAGILRGGTTIFPGVRVRVLGAESHYYSAQVTRYGVENRKDISDHIVFDPKELSVRFEITNSNNGTEEARDVFQQIEKMMLSRELITVDTEHVRYKDMAITGFIPNHEAPFKGAIVGEIRLTQAGIIGEGSNVSATGGRPAWLLANDGTDKTGCNYIYGGRSLPNTDRVQLNACMQKLGSMG